jgi:N-acetylmuramoyl-L-alanine amidase
MFQKRKLALVSTLITVAITISFISAPAQAATLPELFSRYSSAATTGQKIKILVVPGHDDEYWGTEFGSVREADITVALGQHLYNYLKTDPRFDVTISRTQMGYTDMFKNYFETQRTNIQEFIRTHVQAFSTKVQTGQVQVADGVSHNYAKPEVAIRLYGINKWANENNIDLIIHVHVNDHGDRLGGQIGKYQGISIYVPDKQYAPAPTSMALGKAIFTELMKTNKASNMPAEAAGVIEDQDLIAIGASDTLTSAAAALVEYGYIYEPQFRNIDIRDALTRSLAYQTFTGVETLFGTTSFEPKPPVVNVPPDPQFSYTWTKNLQKGVGSKTDINALQTALTKAGVYNCGVVGTFGPCTEKGVKAFQKKYSIAQLGNVGPQTRAKLNQLFSR